MKKQTLFNIIIATFCAIAVIFSGFVLLYSIETQKNLDQWTEWTNTNVNSLFANDGLMYSNDVTVFEAINKITGSTISPATSSATN